MVIPSYEEMANLQKGVLEKVSSFLDKKKHPYEIIVVDDGSKDGSVEFVEEFMKEHKHISLIKNPHLGKAGAVTAGVLSAHGKYVLFTDMDQATPIEEIDKLLPFFEEGYDIVIGSRSGERKNAPFSRLIMSRSVIILRKMIVGLYDISDTQCGFKAFKNEAGKSIFKKLKEIHHGFASIHGSNVTTGFDIELLYLAQKAGFSIKEVPVTWLYVETRRVSPLRDSVLGLLDLLQIKRNAIKGLYT